MKSLIIRAGPRAQKHLREFGLRPTDGAIVPGAAGGPKGLGLALLDEYLFADWLPSGFATRTKPVKLIGASIGAWRFAAVCRNDLREALAALAKAYSEQKYPKKVDAKFVSAYARDLTDALFKGREAELLSNPHYQLNVLVVCGKGILKREARGRTHTGFALAALANAIGRPHLRHFLDRVWFYADEQNTHAPEGRAPIGFPADGVPAFDRFHTHYVKLTPENFGDALIASGSIPLVLEGVAHIADAPAGTFWDGGLIDYHLHLPYHRTPGLVLYPHFTDRIVPGWLDKMLPWRKAQGAWLDNTILVSPTREYLDSLPHRKLPDRNDFKRFIDDYEGRLRYWQKAMAMSAQLRDEFAELVASGRIADAALAL
ncbi:MAG: hypothetical protein ABL931_11065 [Usitatibacteraceae bacterium]